MYEKDVKISDFISIIIPVLFKPKGVKSFHYLERNYTLSRYAITH